MRFMATNNFIVKKIKFFNYFFSQFNIITYPELMSAKNQCRNPESRRLEPFCYTLSDSSSYPERLIEEECAVPQCPPNFYPEIRSNTTTTINNTPPPLIESLTNVWRSLSSQWQLAFVSGLSGILLISFILLICCICCCCRNKSQKQRRKGSQSVLNGGNSATTTIIHNLESGSSVISNGKKGVLGIPSNSINGGGSSMVNRYLLLY